MAGGSHVDDQAAGYVLGALEVSAPVVYGWSMGAQQAYHWAAAVPDVPTMAEVGLPDVVTSVWYGLLVPAATPKAIITKLNQEAVKALRHPDVVRALSSQGAPARAFDATASRVP